MADSSIEWTDKVWNVTRGCSRVSPGCGGAAGHGGCYAERQAFRFGGPGMPYEGLVRLGNQGPRWTGHVRLVAEKLNEPSRWKKPRRIFVNSMSDLFHESLSNEQIAAVFGVMAQCPQHTFQVLTKRAKRMREWFEWADQTGVDVAAPPPDFVVTTCAVNLGAEIDELARPWPLPNVWLGVSAESQEYADERIYDLLATPAAVRFVSYEPALGPVDFRRIPCARRVPHEPVDDAEKARRRIDELRCGDSDHDLYDALRGGLYWEDVNTRANGPRLDWIIVGGESGYDARPFDTEWARSVVKQCRDAGTACFVKQMGDNAWAPWMGAWSELAARTAAGNVEHLFRIGDRDAASVWSNGTWHTWDRNGTGGENASEPTVELAKRAAEEALARQHVHPYKDWAQHPSALASSKGKDMAEWPDDLRVREYPKAMGSA